WIRVSRTLTMANSAATKKALAATSRTTRMILSSTKATIWGPMIHCAQPSPGVQIVLPFRLLLSFSPKSGLASCPGWDISSTSVTSLRLLNVVDPWNLFPLTGVFNICENQEKGVRVANGNGKKKRSRRLLYAIGGVSVIILGVLVFVAATRGGNKIDPSKLAKVEKGDLAKAVVATGKIEPIVKVEVKSKASGIVQSLLADYGDTVKKGQILAELDKQQILAQVNQSRASLEAAEAAARAAEADLERAKYDAEGPDIPMLKRAYDRAQQMAKDGVVSPSALDEAQKNYELAVNKQQLGKANAISAAAKLKQAQAQVSQAKAQLAERDEEYRNSTIVSPLDGVVLSRDVENG